MIGVYTAFRTTTLTKNDPTCISANPHRGDESLGCRFDDSLYFIFLSLFRRANVYHSFFRYFFCCTCALIFFLIIICIPSPSPAATSTTTITSQGNKPILPDIIPIQSPLEGRLKWRMQPWERGRGTVYLHPKRPCKFRGESSCVCLPLYFRRPPPPPLAEIYKEQKIRRGREEGGWFTPRLKSRGEPRERGVICTRDFPPLSTPKGGGKVAILTAKRNELLTGVKTSAIVDTLHIFISKKIWPRTFWTLARLQPRGLNSPLRHFPPPPAMEMASILLLYYLWRFYTVSLWFRGGPGLSKRREMCGITPLFLS